MPSIAKEAVDFSKRVEAIKQATVDYVYNLGQGLSRQDLAVLVSEIDFTALVNDLGYVSNVDKMIASYEGILKGLDPLAPVSEEVLQALASTDKAFYLSKGSDLANTMKQELTRGALLGTKRADMKATIEGLSGFKDYQVEALVDTSQRVFSRSVTAAMADELPDDTKYIYVGATDEKTRDICLEMLAAGELTQAEIEDQFPGAFITGGGINCRHSWRIVTAKSDKLSTEGKAQELLKDNPPSKPPQTPVEQASNG